MALKMRPPSKRLRMAVLTICFVAAVAVLYEILRGSLPTGMFGLLIPIASFGMIRVLVALKVIELPAGFSMGFINRKPKYAEFGKAAACAFAAMLWTVIGIRIVSDTPLGVAVLVTPPVLLLVAMGIFVIRALLLPQEPSQ